MFQLKYLHVLHSFNPRQKKGLKSLFCNSPHKEVKWTLMDKHTARSSSCFLQKNLDQPRFFSLILINFVYFFFSFKIINTPWMIKTVVFLHQNCRFLFIVKGFLFETWLWILNLFFPEIRPSLTTKLHKNENLYDEFRLNV